MPIKTLAINDKCVTEQLDNNLIILNIETGYYHELNQFGTFIWSKIASNNPSREQLQALIDKEDAARETDIDLDGFLEMLLERQLLLEH